MGCSEIAQDAPERFNLNGEEIMKRRQFIESTRASVESLRSELVSMKSGSRASKSKREVSSPSHTGCKTLLSFRSERTL